MSSSSDTSSSPRFNLGSVSNIPKRKRQVKTIKSSVCFQKGPNGDLFPFCYFLYEAITGFQFLASLHEIKPASAGARFLFPQLSEETRESEIRKYIQGCGCSSELKIGFSQGCLLVGFGDPLESRIMSVDPSVRIMSSNSAIFDIETKKEKFVGKVGKQGFISTANDGELGISEYLSRFTGLQRYHEVVLPNLDLRTLMTESNFELLQQQKKKLNFSVQICPEDGFCQTNCELHSPATMTIRHSSGHVENVADSGYVSMSPDVFSANLLLQRARSVFSSRVYIFIPVLGEEFSSVVGLHMMGMPDVAPYGFNVTIVCGLVEIHVSVHTCMSHSDCVFVRFYREDTSHKL